MAQSHDGKGHVGSPPGTGLEAMEARDDETPRTKLVTGPEKQPVFPTLVPPPTCPPESPPWSPQAARHACEEASGSQTLGDSLNTKSKSTSNDAPAGHAKYQQRPTPTKTWKSEIPRTGGQSYDLLRPQPPRAGTSYLNQAIWQAISQRQDGSIDSNSGEEDDSESDEEGDGTPHTPGLSASNDPQDRYGRFTVGNDSYRTSGRVKRDGRLRITVNEMAHTGYLAKALGTAVNKALPLKDATNKPAANPRAQDAARLSSVSTTIADDATRPRLNIVIMVIGSRGDAQPFLKIGKVLKEDYGHRVRIATHPAFRDFVERDSGLEFFSVGGDPSELMAFMVKNPGLIPTLETIKAGDIGRRRAAMAEMFDGFWRACINATDDEKDSQNLKMMGAKDAFVADAIIANPPSFAHIHCAEALGIPLHLMFTFPYTPTQAFPHPLASIKRSNIDPGYTNFISYPLVEMMVWQGLGDLVNEFRMKTLALDPVSTIWAPGATYRQHVPFTYLWSPGLVPKPEDWGSEVDVSGFVFLDLASSFQPSQQLEDFLAAGEKPIYIGFGSIIVDDADRFTQMIFNAVELAGVRALVSKGWGGLGGENVPDNVFMLDNVPHDWLFPRVKACVIHGGAGTTAIALKSAKPTMIVPFFGDQHFWGQMVANAGVGPEPVPYKNLDEERLVEGINYCLTDKAQAAADKIARGIASEGDGAVNAAEHFHRELNLHGSSAMRCSILNDRIAAWELKGTSVNLSPLAADVLVDRGLVTWRRLRLLRHLDWNDFAGPGEPVSGVASSIGRTVGEAFTGIVSVPYRVAKRSKQHRRDKDTERLDNDLMKRLSEQNSPQPKGHLGSRRKKLNIVPTDGSAAVSDRAGQYVGDVTSGMEKTATAIAKAPVNLSMALAQGFHNAPRLYGDHTVRRVPRVTGFYSGLRAARFEFVYGVYDGFTGIIRLPVRGAKDQGVIGLVKGTGMGLTGLVLKNLAALVGPVSYTLKGVVKQAERHKTPRRMIRRARIVQGQREAKALPQNQLKQIKKQVVEGWAVLKELCDVITDEESKRGIAGQIDMVMIDTSALFGNVEVAKRSLKALKDGQTLESLVQPDGGEGRESERGKSSEYRSTSLKRSFNFSRKSKDSSRRSPSRSSREGMARAKKKSGLAATAKAEDVNRLAVPAA